ncbi:MAG: M48 family metallopeptidase [Candidatus Moranbacteria bacterium]|nr:M48 family metallopeptidase [Candidatus Moranbacteria bacterium]
MKREIMLEGNKIEYTLRENARAKNMRLMVCCEGALTVVAPRWLGIGNIENFIFKKAAWILRKKREMENMRKESLFFQKTEKDYVEHKEDARKLVESKLKELNEVYHFEYNKICIRNQQTRWGSCSSKKNLNFNFRIVFLPEHMVNYLIVHELCHLKEMNHSRRFWKLVSLAVPDCKKVSRELKSM